MQEAEVNGKALTMFDAKMLEFSIGAPETNDTYFVPSGRLIPVKMKARLGLRTVTMTLDFYGESRRENTMNISDFTAMLRKSADILMPDGFYYWCELDKVSAPKEVAPWIQQIKFTFSGFRHGPMEVVRLQESGTIYVTGNMPAPAIFSVVPDNGITEFSVNDITVKNVTNTVVIDGIKTTIMENGQNKFKDAPGMISWPLLEPGDFQMNLSPGISVEISYYPIYQ